VDLHNALPYKYHVQAAFWFPHRAVFFVQRSLTLFPELARLDVNIHFDRSIRTATSKMLSQTCVATFALLMSLVLAAPVSEDNLTLVNFTSHLKSRRLITPANTCPKSEIRGVVGYANNRSLGLVASLCGALPEPESILSVYVANCYCSP
jgi:hypothetical protein